MNPLLRPFWLLTLLVLIGLPSVSRAIEFFPQPSDGVFPSTNLQWGQSGITYQISIANQDSTAEAITFNIYLSSTQSVTNSSILIGTASGTVQPSTGTSVSGGVTLTNVIPPGFTSGTNYFVATLSIGSTVEATAFITLSILPGPPDLLPVQAQFSYQGTNYAYGFNVQQNTATWGQSVGVEGAVLNEGSGNAGAFIVRYYISETDSFGSGNAPGSNVVEIPPPESASGLSSGFLFVTFNGAGQPGYTNITLPSTNPFHDSNTHFFLGIIVNPTGTPAPITESIYANNSNQGIYIDSAPITIAATGSTPAPSLSVFGSNPQGSSSQLQFGSINADGPGSATGTQTISILNAGNAALSLNSLAIDSLGTTAGFKITNVVSNSRTLPTPLMFPQTIAANAQEEWTVTVVYDPTAATAQTGTLSIGSNDPTTPTVNFALTGTGLAVPHLAFTNPIPFNGDTLIANYGGIVKNTIENQTFTLSNPGTSVLTIGTNGVVLQDTQGAVWSITSVTSSTKGAINLAATNNSIAANNTETWTIVLKFAPTQSQAYATSLGIFSNDPLTPAGGNPTIACVLQGQGQTAMAANFASAVSGITDTNPLIMNFGQTQATGQQQVVGTVTIANPGQLPLTIPLNGISLASTTNYQITSIVSSTQGPINLTQGSASIAPNGSETWTVNLVFDPTGVGTDNTTLSVSSNDPSQATTQIALNGSGLNQAAILVTTPKGGTTLPFGPVLNDGAGNHVGTQTLTIQDIGLQPLTVNQNGIFLTNATGFSIRSVVSSLHGAINLSTGAASIAIKQGETWTVTVGLDSTSSTASYTGTLSISSNDPIHATSTLSLSGTGTIPTLTMLPTSSSTPLIYIQAGQIYNLSWNGGDTADTAPTANLVFSRAATNTLPATGLTQLTSIPVPLGTTSGTYGWRPDPSLVGQEFYIYGAIQDNGVSVGSFSAQKVHVEAAGSFSLLSPLITTSNSYIYQYTYNGSLFGAAVNLTSGANIINITTQVPGGGTVVHQITVTLVSSLVAKQGFTYDELKRVKTYTNGDGVTTTYTYDMAGDLVSTSANNGNNVGYSYDSLKRRTSMTDSTGTTFYDCDDLDRVKDIIYSTNAIKGDADDVAVNYQYDNAGQMLGITYPGADQVNFTYDDAGRLKTVADIVNGTTTYNYTYTYDTGRTNSSGLLQTLLRGNGVTTKYGYDSLGRINDIKHTNGSGHVLSEYSYTIDANGNASKLLTTFNNGTQKQEVYTYDTLNRLVQVTYGAGAVAVPNTDKTVAYSYDNVGNRLTQTTTVNGAVTQKLTYTYGGENRLLQISDQTNKVIDTYVYDQAGNRVQKIAAAGDTYYAYDERNLLTTMVTPSDYYIYNYNGDTQRVGSTIDGVVTSIIVDPSVKLYQDLQERVGGTITLNNVFGSSERLQSNFPSGPSEFYLYDRLGSVRQITDASGNILTTYAYDVFGQQTTTGN